MKRVILFLIAASFISFTHAPVQAMIGLEFWCNLVGGTWDEEYAWCWIDNDVTLDAAYDLYIVSPENLIINSGASLNVLGSITTLAPYGQLQVFGGALTNNGTIQIKGFKLLISNNGYMSNESSITIFDNSKIINMDLFVNNGTINVDGELRNVGTFISNGTIDNCAIISNVGTMKFLGPVDTCGHIYNEDPGFLYIKSTLNINQDGFLGNSSTVENGGILNNYESFSTSGTFANTGIINNYGINYHGGVLANSGQYNNPGTIYNEGAMNILCSGTFTGNPPNLNPIAYFQNCLFLPAAAK